MPKNNKPEKPELPLDNDEEMNIVTLTDEDGVETDFEIIEVQEYEGQTYYALVPCDQNKSDDEPEDFVILKSAIDENGEEYLVTIEDDDEFDAVAEIFEDIEFEELDYDAPESDNDEN